MPLPKRGYSAKEVLTGHHGMATVTNLAVIEESAYVSYLGGTQRG